MSRKALDLYATPPDVALAICRRVQDTILGRPETIIEPSAGPGRFVAAARFTWSAPVMAVDIDGAHRAACLNAGAASFFESDWQAFAARMVPLRGFRAPPLLIIGNPPFSRAQAHVSAALELLQPGEHLAFLLRLSFLGAEERIDFWERSPLLSMALILPRPSYVDEGNDSTESALFIWRKGYTGRPSIEPPVLHGKALARRDSARLQGDLLRGSGA